MGKRSSCRHSSSLLTTFLLATSLLTTSIACSIDTANDDVEPSGGKADDEAKSTSFFSAEGPSGLRFEADFDVAFAAARAGRPDGIIPAVREKLAMPARLFYASFDGDEIALPNDSAQLEPLDGEKPAVELKVRGNSSLEECRFPKMKLKLRKPHRIGTPFESSFEIKLGTHCSDEDGLGTIGRLRHEKATWRESLAYDVSRSLDLVTPKSKPIIATYVQTTTGTTTIRKAFAFEHQDEVARRIGGKALDDPEAGYEGDPFDAMALQTLVRIHLLNAMLGNWDWDINNADSGRKLWNVDVIVLEDGSQLPLPGDYDLSSFVTGAEPQVSATVLAAESNQRVRQAAYFIAWKMGSTFPRDEMQIAIDHYIAARPAIDEIIDNALVDEEGRANARDHVEAFYTALDSIDEIL